MESIRVLVADDHPVFREGMRALLASAGMELVGEAGSGTEAIDRAAALEPDVVMMDLHMPDVNGIEATRRIVHASPHIAVLVLTMYSDDDSVFAAMRAGARGYLLKGDSPATILEAIRAVARAEAIFGPAIAQRLMHYFSALQPGALPNVFPELTTREREVLHCIAQGLNNLEIAQRLVLSPKTVRNLVSNIFSKLQVADRAQAIIRAREAGLGQEKI